MRIALISDIHSNLQALESILEYVDDGGVDDVYCLGDIVGYGADPQACVELIRDRCSEVVLGNHDLAIISEPHQAQLPRDGRKAAKHNRKALSNDSLAYLKSLPYIKSINEVTLVHATPIEPEKWIRLSSFQLSQAQFGGFEGQICFMGHTHRPTVISDKLGVSQVRTGHRYLINVGSVGQPRDGDPRACVGIFDMEDCAFRLERVDYDIDGAIERIKAEKLPKRLGERLKRGV